MKKTLGYYLLGSGKIPAGLMTELQSELIEVSDEGIHGSVTTKNFRSPGKLENWRRIWFSGAIAVTGGRLVALQYSKFAINVPFDDDRFRLMNISLEPTDTLLVAFDASLFHADWSGQIEYRYRTLLAQNVVEAIQRHSPFAHY
ncbi:MAG: hypothetical protein ACREO5_10695 [Candidatus Binatia bacterium]